MDRKKIKLEKIKKDGKNFDLFCTIKQDAYSMPCKFYATTVYYPATSEETQTFLATVDAEAYLATEKIGTIFKTDEFDSAREATKWINEVFEEFLDIIFS